LGPLHLIHEVRGTIRHRPVLAVLAGALRAKRDADGESCAFCCAGILLVFDSVALGLG
jgi:hypothetical protein